MNWKIVGSVIIIVLVILAIVAYSMWNKPHVNYENVETDYKLKANELFDELKANGTDAEEKYTNKVVELEGEIEDISQSSDSNYSIFLKADNAMMGGINARMSMQYSTDKEKEKFIETLEKGETVVLKCRYQGFEDDLLTEVKLDNCFIIK